MPTKSTPCAWQTSALRALSENSDLPASMRMSSGSSNGRSSSIKSSTGFPAFTMTMATRGFDSAATNSGSEFVGTKRPSAPCSRARVSVRAAWRLNNATPNPLRAALRARFSPMTESPTTPGSAFAISMIHRAVRRANRAAGSSGVPSAAAVTFRPPPGRDPRTCRPRGICGLQRTRSALWSLPGFPAGSGRPKPSRSPEDRDR